MSRKYVLTSLLAIGGIAIVVVFLAWVMNAWQRAQHRQEEMLAQYRREWIATQLAELRSGKSDHLYFYDTYDTDELLKVFNGMPQVHRVGFELTDISEDGMKIVAGFPNLRELMLYGGHPNVDDNGLRHLSEHMQLEKLELINTEVTDRGLEVLTTLPELRSLTLDREAFRDVTLTDKGLLSLQNLDNLEELTIDGGWASDAAVQQLKAKMPNCKISTESDW